MVINCSKCPEGAGCCGCIPFPKELFEKYKNKIKVQPIDIKEGEGVVIAVTENLKCVFLDVLFTWNMKRQGYEIYADFDVWVSHLHAAGTHLNAFSKEQAVELVDLWLPEYDNYAIGIEVNPRNRKKKLKPAQTWEI